MLSINIFIFLTIFFFVDAVEIFGPTGNYLKIATAQKGNKSQCQIKFSSEYAKKLQENSTNKIAIKFSEKCGIQLNLAFKLVLTGFLLFFPPMNAAGVKFDGKGENEGQMWICPRKEEIAKWEHLYHFNDKNGIIGRINGENEIQNLFKNFEEIDENENQLKMENGDKLLLLSVFPEKVQKILGIIEKVISINVAEEFGEKIYPKEGQRKIMEIVENDGGNEDVDFGRKILEMLCGERCNQKMMEEFSEYGVTPHSQKGPPTNSELERALRPSIIHLARQISKGRLWVDNPLPRHRNGFLIGYEFDGTPEQKELLNWHLSHFMRFGPFIFVETSKEYPILFKHVLQFQISKKGRNSAPNGLKRNKREQIVKIKEEMLPFGQKAHFYDQMVEFEKTKRKFVDPIMNLLLRALCLECGENIEKAEYLEKMKKYLPKEMLRFVRLNAAYGAENYYILCYNYRFFEPANLNPQIPGNVLAYSNIPATTFWFDYPNMETGKYEIPVFVEKRTSKWLLPLLKKAFRKFSKNTAIEFVQLDKIPENKFFVHIQTNIEDPWGSISEVGHSERIEENYEGEILRFGKTQILEDKNKGMNVIFHELFHVVGLEHENMRADSAPHKKLDWRPFFYRQQPFWGYYTQNYLINYNYLPPNEFNTQSAMFLSENAAEVFGKYFVKKPHKKDWQNVNYFYGVELNGNKFKN